MPTGTTYNPPNIDAFIKTALNFDAQGVSTTATAGSVTNLDYELTDDCLVTGMELIVNGGNYGDTANLQIIDTTGYFSGTPGKILNQFATNWHVAPIADTQFDMAYPAKILATMTLRVAYTSTGTTNPFVAINYKLHKVLF
jgi:hypothetical protein